MNSVKSSFVVAFSALVVAHLPTPVFASSVSVNITALKRQYIKPTTIPQPLDNKATPARVQLGRMLFFDPRLSGSNWISCATCHNPAMSWGDGLAKGFGHGMKQLARRTPTLLNLAWGELMFWDGRAGSLEEQALGPIQAEGEMNLPHEKMIGKLANLTGYKAFFDGAYPNEGVTANTVAKAIAAFERTIVSGKAPFDRWIAGDRSAISASAIRGFEVFNTKGKCASCHSTWRFTDDGFHDIGIAGDDLGRGKILPEIPAVQFAFKTPTLRNIDHRGPYMHDGSESSLESVIELYDRGGKVRRPTIAEQIRPLGLSPTEKMDLIAFMKTLTSKDPEIAAPMLPR